MLFLKKEAVAVGSPVTAPGAGQHSRWPETRNESVSAILHFLSSAQCCTYMKPTAHCRKLCLVLSDC